MENKYQCSLSARTFLLHCICVDPRNPIPSSGQRYSHQSQKWEVQRISASLPNLSLELVLLDPEPWNSIWAGLLAAQGWEPVGLTFPSWIDSTFSVVHVTQKTSFYPGPNSFCGKLECACFLLCSSPRSGCRNLWSIASGKDIEPETKQKGETRMFFRGEAPGSRQRKNHSFIHVILEKRGAGDKQH